MIQGIRTQRLLLISGTVVLANVVIGGVAVATNARPKRLVAAARAPSPPSALRNRQVVVAEGEEGRDEPDDVAEEDVEAVVAEVEPARGCDVNGCEPRNDADQKQVQRRCSGLAAHGGDCARVLRKPLLLDCADAATRIGAPARGTCRTPRGHLVRFGSAHGGIHGRVVAGPRREGGERFGVDSRAGGKEGDGDGELAGDEEREVDETW